MHILQSHKYIALFSKIVFNEKKNRSINDPLKTKIFCEYYKNDRNKSLYKLLKSKVCQNLKTNFDLRLQVDSNLIISRLENQGGSQKFSSRLV